MTTIPAHTDPLTADHVVVAMLAPGDILIGLPHRDRDSGPIREATVAAAHRVGATVVILPLPDRDILSVRGGSQYTTLPYRGDTYTVGLPPAPRPAWHPAYGTTPPAPHPATGDACEFCGRQATGYVAVQACDLRACGACGERESR